MFPGPQNMQCLSINLELHYGQVISFMIHKTWQGIISANLGLHNCRIISLINPQKLPHMICVMNFPYVTPPYFVLESQEFPSVVCFLIKEGQLVSLIQ